MSENIVYNAYLSSTRSLHNIASYLEDASWLLLCKVVDFSSLSFASHFHSTV